MIKEESAQVLELTAESIETELIGYKDKPYECLFEYIWNSFDAQATEVSINYSIPESTIGYISDVSIEDNGVGWDFEKEKNTKMFLSSSKFKENTKNKTLPRGKFGRGRYVFFWIANELKVLSSGQSLILKRDTEVNPIVDKTAPTKGTKVVIIGPNLTFSRALVEEKYLINALKLHFCWFLEENPNFNIFVNGKKVDYTTNIEKKVSFTKNDLPKELFEKINDELSIDIILWKNKPEEWSNLYFIDPKSGSEIFVKSSGMNKKGDDFWHSVFIKSEIFSTIKSSDIDTDYQSNQLKLYCGDNKDIGVEIIKFIVKKLIELRKPYLFAKSNEFISDLKRSKKMPNLKEFGICDEENFDDLLKTIYTISPSVFVGRNEKEVKFFCATFAGLLSTNNDELIKIILEQLQDLSDQEVIDLKEILKRTKLSNIVNTVKEINGRLDTLTLTSKLLFQYEKETLEVENLQKVLNDNFWIFGEQFRLFANTEGALSKTLRKYAMEILKIDNPDVNTVSRKELDIFLTKTDHSGIDLQENIIIEIKRPSIKIGKKQYLQIEEYATIIKKESICNGDCQSWELYLIGNDYDEYIVDRIESMKNYGEKRKGLVMVYPDKNMKIYVRKWSDILEAEWGSRLKFLKDKLKTQEIIDTCVNPDEITQTILKK